MRRNISLVCNGMIIAFKCPAIDFILGEISSNLFCSLESIGIGLALFQPVIVRGVVNAANSAALVILPV